MPSEHPEAVIFDLGDVLFNWSPHTKTSVPAETLRKIIASQIWNEYECGRISQTACFQQAAETFSIPVKEIAEAFQQARASLQPNQAMVDLIRGLHGSFQDGLKLYAMSNISKEDMAFLAPQIQRWAFFDRVFASGHVGMRKPDLGFYQHVLNEVDVEAQDAVFIDDKECNVAAAQSLGIIGIIFNDNTTIIRNIRSLFDRQIQEAYRFLDRHTEAFNSASETGVVIPENFARLLMLEAIGESPVSVKSKEATEISSAWNGLQTREHGTSLQVRVFRTQSSVEDLIVGIDKPVLIPGGYYPDDLDTTALALMLLHPDTKLAHSILDEMLGYVNPDGSIQVYYDRTKARQDEVVTANILACFFHFGRGHEVGKTLSHIREVIESRKYAQGTRYYISADYCLYTFMRILLASDDAPSKTSFEPILREHLQQRVGQQGSALDLATRIISCNALGIGCEVDRAALSRLQCDDGGWEMSWMYRYGSTGIRIGNRGVPTALAIKALACC